jgi:peptide-methionine (R)-S-oxide reductase
MTTRRALLSGSAVALALAAVQFRLVGRPLAANVSPMPDTFAVSHDEAEWRKLLTPTQYSILRQEGTEAPYTSPLLNEHRSGRFTCAGCNNPAFSSETKFDSHTGWPSFWTSLKGAVGERQDTSFGISRTAVYCSQCGGHLGHVFDDGPQPTGLRYCMNGAAMGFVPEKT